MYLKKEIDGLKCYESTITIMNALYLIHTSNWELPCKTKI